MQRICILTLMPSLNEHVAVCVVLITGDYWFFSIVIHLKIERFCRPSKLTSLKYTPLLPSVKDSPVNSLFTHFPIALTAV